MPLTLDTMRAEFARFLAEDPSGRWRMDRALAHVLTIAYERGMEEGRRSACDACGRAEERQPIAEFAATVERCYRMLMSEPDTKSALFKAENILREALADQKVGAGRTAKG